VSGFNLSALAVRERAVTLFLLIALTGAGFFAFEKLGRAEDPAFTVMLDLDMGTVVPSLAGPKRPQDKVELTVAAPSFETALAEVFNRPTDAPRVAVEGEKFDLGDGDVVIAAITSCTNTSNPSVLIAAGLVARKANKLGLKVKPWVKTSLAPGSQVVTDYLTAAGLQADLDALGFNLVGYGCTTCIGNSGPLAETISKTINDNGLVATSVLLSLIHISEPTRPY